MRNRSAAALALFLLLPTWGCTIGGQSGTETDPAPCRLVDSRQLAADQSSPLGTPADVAAQALGQRQVWMGWGAYDAEGASRPGATTLLTLQMASYELDSARYTDWAVTVRRIACPDILEMNATLDFRTADGSFSEQFAGRLHAEEGGLLAFEGTMPAEASAGSYDPSGLIANYGTNTYSVRTTLGPTVQGRLDMAAGVPPWLLRPEGSTFSLSPPDGMPIALWPVPPATGP